MIAVPAFGHDLNGPHFVFADVLGHFSYDVTLVVTSTTEFGSTYLDGSDNTDLEVWIDGFCLNAMEPGTSVIAVEGNLINESSNATVVSTVNLCDGWTNSVTTTVVPFPVASQASTWGTVKSLYHGE